MCQEREYDIRNIMNIIRIMEKNQENKNYFSIGINAKWGNGKTYFVKMWEEWLKIEPTSCNRTIYYNAWEYDDFLDPLLPLSYKIFSLIDIKEDVNFLEYAKVFMMACGSSAIKVGINKLFGEEVSQILDDGIDSMSDAEIKTVFSEFDTYFNRRELLIEKIGQLIPEGGKLWIIIDGLDKCRPDFSLRTLEEIKHYFNIPNLLFIFSVDLEQLSNSLKKIYGKSINVDSYLRNFFDFVYDLAMPDIKEYVKQLVERRTSITQKATESLNYIILMFEKLEFSIKEIELSLNHILFFFEFYKEDIERSRNYKAMLRIYIYFIILKDKFNSDYRNIVHGKFKMKGVRNSNLKKIDTKFIVNGFIKKLLSEIMNRHADENTVDLFEKYGMISIPNIRSFSKHIEFVLNYNIIGE